MKPTVFLGLVTYEGTHFTAASSPDGLVHQVASEFDRLGRSTVVQIHTTDDFDSSGVELTQLEVLRSINAELDLESEWRSYLNPSDSGLRLVAEMQVRRLYRRMRYAPPWRTRWMAGRRGAAMIRRLVNIELSHLNLLHSARNSGASWTLIVEDDAFAADAKAFATHLDAFLDQYEDADQPKFMNLSLSFDHETLKIANRFRDIGQWDKQTTVLASDRPVTNTVCAILYRNTFLSDLVPALVNIPISPVLPIDWKLNAALLNLYRAEVLGAGDCWFVEPGPIHQGSMDSDRQMRSGTGGDNHIV